MTDYRALLVKYIDHVGKCEGVTYVAEANPDHRSPWFSDVPFTAEEYAALAECETESAP